MKTQKMQKNLQYVEKCSIINNESKILNMKGDMMNKTIKIIVITLVSIFLIFSMSTYSKASSLDDIIEAGNSFLRITPTNTNVQSVNKPSETDLKAISKTVSGVLLTVAIGVTVISAVVMGINFTIQSIEDKAKIKEAMIPWMIGIFVAFGAYGIWKITMAVFYQII